MWSGSNGRSDGSNNFNLSWIWIVAAIVLFAVLFSEGGGGAWWLIFPLFWWVVPAIRRMTETPEQREAREQRRAAKRQWKDDRHRARHPERYATYSEMSKRKNDDDESLDDLVEAKRKNAQSPRYVLIGDGEIMQVDGDEELRSNEPDNTAYGEPPLHSRRDDGYI